MFLQKKTSIDVSKLIEIYGIKCQDLLAQINNFTKNFGITYCVIDPGKQTEPQYHLDYEIFLFLEGEGAIQIDDQLIEIKKGSLITVNSYQDHQIFNYNKTKELKLISFHKHIVSDISIPSNIFIHSAPPTPNGGLHIGHLSGPYLNADVISRFYKMQKTNVLYQTSLDINQPCMITTAKNNNISVESLYNESLKRIKEAFKLANITPDIFFNIEEKNSNSYQKLTHNMFDILYQKNCIEYINIDVVKCNQCNNKPLESEIITYCNKCKHNVTGCCCESCGSYINYNDPNNISYCMNCNTKLIHESSKEFVIDLSKYKNDLKNFYNISKQRSDISATIIDNIENNLHKFVITNDSNYGLTTEGKNLHVWFEMGATIALCSKSSKVDNYIFTFGIDNQFYYTILIPVMLIAYYDEITQIPKLTFLRNEFMFLEGRKFSTSRNHAIWVDKFLKSEDFNYLRLFLSKMDNNYQNNNFLIQEFNNYVVEFCEKKLNKFIQKVINYTAAPKDKKSKGDDLHLIRQITFYKDKIATHYSMENFSLSMVVRTLECMLEEIIYYSQNKQISQWVQRSYIINFLLFLYPIMPDYVNNILSNQNIKLLWPHEIIIK